MSTLSVTNVSPQTKRTPLSREVTSLLAGASAALLLVILAASLNAPEYLDPPSEAHFEGTKHNLPDQGMPVRRLY
ncbi:MAG: hypothetical protein HKN27_05370 [Silicimonas sp.]|nr:hypothetical protein [Silicimonas sp.]